MPIDNLPDAIGGMLPPLLFNKTGATMEAVNVQNSFFYSIGNPGAAAAPSPGLIGAALTSYAGQIPFPPAVVGKNTHLSRLEAVAQVVGGLALYDRLWHNSGIVNATLTEQAIDSVAFPARDMDGATAGRGVGVALEVSTLMTNAAIANTTLRYTNSTGDQNRVATIAMPASAQPGTFVPFNLQAGDVGVQSIQGLTLGTTYATGVMHLVAFRFIARVPVTIVNVPCYIDFLTGGNPIMYDESVPFFVWLPSATTALNLSGHIIYCQA